MMRIAVGGLHMECSTYNPVLAKLEDFDVLRKDKLLEHAYFSFLKEFKAEFRPIMHARAIAGGPIARGVYEAFKTELLAGFERSKPLDGVYLAMHGAMFVEGLENAEGDFISAVREVVGSDCVIAASYDLHGNLSQTIIDALDIFSTYRTAPHIDVEETMRRTVVMHIRSLSTGVRPYVVWAPVPVLLPGEKSSTVDEPAKSFYAQLPSVDAKAGIWDASFQVGYVWADEPRATAAAVLTGVDLAKMEPAAAELAQNYWDKRNEFSFGVVTGSIAECVSWAMASESSPAIIAESGDNPTGGGVGDRAEVLAALLAAKAHGVIFAGIADRPATDAAYSAGSGTVISIVVGASLDQSSAPVKIDARVLCVLPADDPSDRQAVLQIDGITLVVTAKRRPFHKVEDFTRLGLDVSKADILVVKSGYLSPELAALAKPALMALSSGAVDQYVERLPRLRKGNLMFPFDNEFPWKPQVYRSERSCF